MRIWRWSAAVVVWLLSVAVVAGVAWFAIDSAGHEVGGVEDVVRIVPSGAVPSPPTGTTGSGGPSPDPSSPTLPSVASPTTVTTAREVDPSASPGTVSPVTSPAGPSRPATSGATSASPGGAPTTPPGSGPSGGLRPTPGVTGPGTGRTATFTFAGGDLDARCRDAKVEGWGLRPADGWRAEATPGPRGVLDAVFTADTGEVLQVQALCRDGMPVFDVRPPPRPAG